MKNAVSKKALLAFSLSISVLIGGCMSMPISTMYKMSQFSLADMKPAAMRVAIRTNEAIEVKNGAAKVNMSYVSEGSDTMEPVNIDYKINVIALHDIKADFAPILLDGIEDRERVTILKLSNEDAKNMQDLLDLAKKYKANDVKGTGSFGISLDNNCFGNLDKFSELEVDLFLQTDESEGFMMFLEDIDIIEQAADNNINLKQVNKCEAE